MVQAAFLDDSILGNSNGFGFRFTFGKQTVWLVGLSSDDLPPTHTEDLDTYLQSHLSKLGNLAAEDVELLLAKLRHMYGSGLRLGLAVIEDNRVLYGVVGGSVYFDRNGRGGWLARKAIMPVIHTGELQQDDLLLVLLDDEEEQIATTLAHDRAKIGLLPGWGLALQGVMEVPTPVVMQPDETAVETAEPMPATTPTVSRQSGAWRAWLAARMTKPTKTFVNPEIYVKGEERKRLGMMVLGLLVVLLLSIGLGWRKRQANLRAEAFDQVYEPTLALLIDAEKGAAGNPLLARDTLITARKNIEAVLPNYKENSSEHEKLTTLLNQVVTLYQRVSGEMTVEAPPVYFDLHLVKDDMSGDKMAFGDGWVVVLDKSRGLLVGVETANKQAKILAGGEILQGASLVAASTGKAVVQTNGGLVGVFFGNREPERLVETDPIWENLGAMGMFGGNVYLVDRSLGEVWQYPGFDGGLGERRRWFGPGVLPDLSSVSAISVDGDLWLGMTDGTLTHFRRGAPLNVRLTGLAVPLGEVVAIAAEYEKDDLYVLDKGNKRVVMFGKDGSYKKQFVWEGMTSVTDMVVIAGEKSPVLLLLAGSKIYQIPVQ